MLSRIGAPELLIILAIALLIFGPSSLPKLGKALGQTIGSFKQGHAESVREDEEARKKGKETVAASEGKEN